jgi:predicted RNA methylase
MAMTEPLRDVFDRAFQSWRTQITCRPTMGEYPVYDDHLYRWLLEDQQRMQVYQRAIAAAAPGRRVVDLGTGADAPLAIMCARAGASHIDAIEVIPAAAAAAQRRIAELGLDGLIRVHCGSSATVSLDQPAELCVSEIIGMIGGAEGAAAALHDARRLLGADGRMLPGRCITWFAPAAAASPLHMDADCATVADHYTERIFRSIGHRFPLTRIVTFNFPEANLLAVEEPFEDLDFNAEPIERGADSVTFNVTRSGQCAGFVLWIELHVDADNIVNSWQGSSWAPVFLAMSPVSVEPGDAITVNISRFVRRPGENPSYEIIGDIYRGSRRTGGVEVLSHYA